MKASSSSAPNGELALRVIALDKDTNSNGDIYAGWLMSQMDLAAASMAGRIAKGRTATVSVKQLDFLSPVRVGAEVSCYARMVNIGTSSMHIEVEVWTRDNHQNTPRKVTEGVFVLVAIDDSGRIRAVPAGE
ncbi:MULTISPECIES: acyl-CoA thioesterase [Hahella]|uniref:Acyl-CoA hydrolase n=1 Tax=Hahella chejuensis (strain KCTC 2396) TaxID=349521 RepID=Q2SNY1_HAHCH|nr:MULTISPECIES: acyl-CoA thioesterase [Hahella]ABC27643.1 Acyl-CoA hydrolase [Hahella chejuensis KCTC 2396]MBU6954707.1 acyl-CoA thioesterase [Hahella sp. HN01]MDG9668898.1 acyl-CoA thioesterase [Hahella sp. CR1]